MTTEFDTSWFDLKNYEAFKTMPIENWILQLAERHYCYMLVSKESLPGDKRYLSYMDTKGWVYPG
jgi:hypothetical protein